MKRLRKAVGDIWELYNTYGRTQEQLAGLYKIPRTVVAQFVNAKNKNEAWKKYKNTLWHRETL
jgi:hypothetical protein